MNNISDNYANRYIIRNMNNYSVTSIMISKPGISPSLASNVISMLHLKNPFDINKVLYTYVNLL